ncbi:MAG: twin-arginine translocase subunit TatC [Bacteroidales bacterium]|jgi:sec-independent protein translocase protein TatC|nr:twin-arginine translocase subunit TatC [Bacteroidales bacterium]
MSDNSNITFWDHLEVLRWTIIRIVIVFFVFTIGFFYFMPKLFDHFILAPCHSDFFLYKFFELVSFDSPFFPDFSKPDFHVDLININLASQFIMHISSACWFAFICTCPYIIFEIYRFISSALYKKEKNSVLLAFIFGTIMFYIGCCVSYVMVFPLTLRFLSQYQVSAEIPNQISLNSYMSNFFTLILVMGLVFELPLVSWLLSKLGLLTKSFFRRYRRHAVVILLIAAALITPSGDPFTLMIVFLPLYILYEISALFVKKEVPV